MTAAVALWLQPALLAIVVLRVTAGAADGPWLTLGILVAPLVALLALPRAAASNRVAAGAAGVVITALLAAGFLVGADVATLLGGQAWQGILPVAVFALLVPRSPAADRLAAAALLLGLAALLSALAGLAAATAMTPWTAWTRGGQPSALTFSEGSVWVRDGERLARPARLTFGEAQRVTVLTAGVYRVVEHDAARPTVREWRLEAGGTLTLRPGDELSAAAGARLRFEAGRRVPGAPASGVAWADAPARGPAMLPAALGLLVTLVGGAVALVPAASRRGPEAAAGPVLLLIAVSTAVGWGIYAAATAGDLALGGSLPAPLLRLPALVLGPRGGSPLVIVAGAGLALLLGAATIGLRRRFAVAVGPARTLWAAAVLVAAGLAVWPLDPWQLVTLGLGLAAAAWLPSRVTSVRAAGVAGSIVGGMGFIALASLPATTPGPAWLEALIRFPALLALPLGWAAARAVGVVLGDEPDEGPAVRAAPARTSVPSGPVRCDPGAVDA